MTTTVINDYRPGYHELFANHITRKCGWERQYTDLVIEDALRFLTICTQHPDEHLVSSQDVDEIVDALVLDTALLAWLEENVWEGKKITHIPNYAHDQIERARLNTAYTITIEYMRENGPVNPQIWRELSDTYGPCVIANCRTCGVKAA